MKPQLGTGFVLGLLVFMFMPAGLSARTPQKASQPDPAANADHKASASAKEKIPLPQVPRITAEEVQRLIKEKGNVVLVDTDDSESYSDEHIKGAVNIAYDPTADPRAQDETLSALPGNRLIVFYCNCPHEEDSAPLVLEMWELNYDHDKVKALQGGLVRWEQLKYPLAGSSISTASTEKGN
jgi:rhodanese-related sulfurtransferase